MLPWRSWRARRTTRPSQPDPGGLPAADPATYCGAGRVRRACGQRQHSDQLGACRAEGGAGRGTARSGGSPAIQPVSGGGSARRTDRSANQANAGGGEPMILHGADRSWASPARSSVSAGGNATPSSSLIVIGRKEGTQPEQAGSTAPWSRATISRQDSYTRSAGSPRNQPFMTADSEVQAPAQSSWSEPHAYAPTVRSEQPSQYTAPAYRAPAETPRSAPAQHYEQPRVQSYSPPAASYAPRVEPMVSQPVHSAPPAPAPSAPATQSQSSSGGNRR